MVLAAAALAGVAAAVVDLSIANYSDTWTDMEYVDSGTALLTIERAYNSRSLFDGIFGFGWCSDFETRLEVRVPRQHLVLKWCGDFSTTSLLADRLSAPNLRYSSPAGDWELLETEDGYTVRHLTLPDQGEDLRGQGSDPVELELDLEGRLRRTVYDDGRYLDYQYQLGRLREVRAGTGESLVLDYGSDGKVRKVTGPEDLEASYRYTNRGDLAWSRSARGNEYEYNYDPLHNLVRVVYPDGTEKRIQYDTDHDWAVGFEGRDRCQETYRFFFSGLSAESRDHYWAIVEKHCDGRLEGSARFEYFYRARRSSRSGTPSRYLSRTLTIVNQSSDDIHYDEYGRILSRTQNGLRTDYVYNDDGTYTTTVVEVSEPGVR